VVFGKVDTEAQQDLAGMFNIISIPTLMIVRDRVVLFSQPGAPPEARSKPHRAGQGRDMDDVRAKIAEEQRAG
jgi:thioredoxin 1